MMRIKLDSEYSFKKPKRSKEISSTAIRNPKIKSEV
jgi:hypothetical protein